jgi:lysophospholipase L1-like esterase
MRSILVYGDSNTWGFIPGTGDRYDRGERWPQVLAEELGEEYEVVSEGLNGRTTVLDDPVEGKHRNGESYLLPCLESHKPLDLVIIMLGTNDLKARFGLPALDIAQGAGKLVELVQKSATGPMGAAPDILLLAPAPVRVLPMWEEMFEGAEEKSELFAEHFGAVAEARGCHFMDTGALISVSSRDGVHLDASEHLKLGTAVAERVRAIFGEIIEEDDTIIV